MRYYSSDCELSLSYWDRARVELWLIGTQVLLGSLAGSATRLDLQAKRDRRAHAHARTSARTPLLLLLPACSILRPPSSTKDAASLDSTLGSALLDVPYQGLHLHKCSCLQPMQYMFPETNHKYVRDAILHVF